MEFEVFANVVAICAASQVGCRVRTPIARHSHSCTLVSSGPVVAKYDGQIIEDLRIIAKDVPAIRVEGHRGVTIRNVEIEHTGAPGIWFTHADDLSIENAEIIHAGAPASGSNANPELVNIIGEASERVRVDHVTLRRGSAGIYLLQCPSSRLRNIDGHDIRGPLPRGQLVQWDKSDDGALEDFSVVNTGTSWSEDNVNAYRSRNMTIRRGFIDGNNSPTGVAVVFDSDGSSGLVEDVDAIHMGNGCYSNVDGAGGTIFRRTRCRDNMCTDQAAGQADVECADVGRKRANRCVLSN